MHEERGKPHSPNQIREPSGSDSGARRTTETVTVEPSLLITIRRELHARTHPSRTAHIVGVEGMSVILANRWNVPVSLCHLSGLLHDLAKPYPLSVQREKLDECTVLPVSEDDRLFPAVWHGIVAAQEAHDLYGVDSRDVLEAVAYHSTGARDLSDVGLVLYIADYIEPSRSWEGVEEFRQEVLAADLHEAAGKVASRKICRLGEKGRPAHPRTQEMAEWLTSFARKGG